MTVQQPPKNRRRRSGLVPMTGTRQLADPPAFMKDVVAQMAAQLVDEDLADLMAEAGPHGFIAVAVNMRPVTEKEVVRSVTNGGRKNG